MKKTVILVTGSNGQLGCELQVLAAHYPHYTFIFTDKDELDITQVNQVEALISEKEINVIINTAAYTNVEKAEDEEEKANAINNTAVANLAKLSKQNSIKLIHISTDYVFDGSEKRPYLESDFKYPLNVYGTTKAKGEDAMVAQNPPNSAIIRTSWLYSSFGNNFVKKMKTLLTEKEEISVVADQTGAPTYAADLAISILEILPKLNSNNTEIYHFTNLGSCTWYLFAQKIKLHLQSNCTIKAVDSTVFKTKSVRPKYSILDTQKIKNTFHIEIPQWENSLEKCLKIIKK